MARRLVSSSMMSRDYHSTT